MRRHIGKHLSQRETARLKKKLRIRRRIQGTLERPRLCVFRSLKRIYVQLIDDSSGRTLLSASSYEVDKARCGNKEIAQKVGELIASKAKAQSIENVVFDRNGFLYHGRIKAVADGARLGGLDF